MKCPRYPNQRFVLQKKWAKIHQNRLIPTTPIMLNFIEIGETTLEKIVRKFFYTL